MGLDAESLTPSGPGQRSEVGVARVAPASAAPLGGRTVAGRYQVGALLGAGGMASVYAALDTATGAEVALKVLRPELAIQPVVRERFLNEARAVAQIEGPYLVSVRDAGTDGEYLYIAMDLVTGGSVSQWVQENGPMSVSEAKRVTDQLLQALDACHRAGVVHRDVKPSNVLLTVDGEVCLTDFGIARLGDASGGLTQTGAVLGTVSYMAPEQHLDARQADARADVYAVGAMLYALLTGKKPYGLDQEALTSDRLAEVPTELRPVVWRATRPAPEARFASAASMRGALWGDAVTVQSSGRSPWLYLGLGGVALGALALAAVLVGVGMWSLQRGPSEPADAPIAAELAVPDVAPTPEPAVPVAPPAAPDPEPAPVPAASAPAKPVPAPVSAGSGTLFLNSIPPAPVAIDGQPQGSGRWRGSLSAGTHTVRWTPATGEPVTRQVTIRVDDEARLCWDFRSGQPCSR